MSVELPPHVDGVWLLTQARTDRACSLDFMHIPRTRRDLQNTRPRRFSSTASAMPQRAVFGPGGKPPYTTTLPSSDLPHQFPPLIPDADHTMLLSRTLVASKLITLSLPSPSDNK